MGRSLDEVIKDLPVQRQKKIAAAAQEKMADMLAQAATLTDFRKAVGKTQVEVANALGINQNAVSQLEKRSDTYVSTLRRYLQSMGMTLELSVLDKNGVRIELPNFLPWSIDQAANDAAAKKPVAKKISVKASSPKKVKRRSAA